MEEKKGASIGIKILCFLIQILGLILYLTNQSENELYAKQCGKSAIIGIIVAIALPIIMIFVSVYITVMLSTSDILSASDTVSTQFQNMEMQQSINITDNSTNNKTGSTNTTNNKTSNNSSSVTQASNNKTSTYKVNYAGFKLYIPDDLLYEKDRKYNSINVGDVNQTWLSTLTIVEMQYQQLKQKKNYLSTYFGELVPSYNGKISDATIETIDGVEFIILEVSIGGTNEILAITGLNSTYSMYIDFCNENNDFDRDYLKNITPIIKTIEYTGTSSYMKANENIDTKTIVEALEKVTEED